MTQQEGNISFNKNGQTMEQGKIGTDGLDFEPTKKVKDTYLYRRKKPRDWGTITYPGLFDKFQSADNGWFLFTFGMEVISLLTAIFLLESVPLSISLMVALLVFFADFSLAFWHHRYKGVESLIANQKLLFLPEMRSGQATGTTYSTYYHHLEQELNSNIHRKYLKWLFGFLILFITVIKVGIFLVAVSQSYWFATAIEDSKGPYFLIIVIVAMYFWIFFNHWNFTGYYLAAVSSNNAYKKEFEKHNKEALKINKSENTAKSYKEEVVNLTEFLDVILREKDNHNFRYFTNKSHDFFKNDLKEGVVEIRLPTGHSIKKSEEKEGCYVFTKKGFLTDDQINDMVRVQKSKLSELAVAMYFHKFQMESATFNAVN